MSIAYVAGFIVGVLMVALVGFLVNKLATGKFGMKKCEFDERQNLAKGLAYRDGFWTLFIGIFALLIIGRLIPEYIAVKINVDPFALYSTLVTIFCFLGITVFLISSIMRDAYVGINQNKKRWQWYLLVIGLINLFGAYSNRGFVSAAVLSLCCAFLTFSGFIALIIRSLLDKKDEEE